VTLLTLQEVAELGRVSLRTVERAVQNGSLHTIQISPRRRVVREDEAARWAGLLSPSEATPRED
jgi:excisionase family DNA binding protein